MRRIWRWFLAVIIGGWLPVLLLVWWWNASADSVDPFFPPLSVIWEQFKFNWIWQFWGVHVMPTLQNLILGFLLATAIAIPLGVFAGSSPTAARYIEPLVDFFRSIPPVALVPIFILVLGLDATMRVAAITIAASFPILLNTIEGVRSTNSVLLDTASVFRLTRSQVLWRVRLPNAMPTVFAGLQVGFQIAFIVAIASELLGAGFGLGAFTLIATDTFMILDAWTGVMLLGILGYLLNIVFDVIERISLRWYFGQKKLA
jgi:sulfonate transport system permease protein